MKPNWQQHLDETPETERFTFSIEADSDGYIDFECPATECKFCFKVNADDAQSIGTGDDASCPMCGLRKLRAEFMTPTQQEIVSEHMSQSVSAHFGSILAEMLDDFNSEFPDGGPISIQATVNHPAKPLPPAPIKSDPVFQLKIQCEKCQTRFAVVGSAFFCPKCGHSSAVRVFKDSLERIETSLKHLDRVYALIGTVSRDEAEIMCRSMVEACLSNGVVAIQRLFEQLYREKAGPNLVPPKNVFQRIQEGSDLWAALIGKAYSDFLTPTEMARLKVFFQRRHLLQHQEGMVDQKYISQSGDATYQIGQRIIVRPEDVLVLGNMLRKLAGGFLKELGYGT